MRASRTKSRSLPPWRSFAFWQKIFIYYFLFSLGGHYLEILWAIIGQFVFGLPPWRPTIVGIAPLAPPYGFGAVAAIVIIKPLIKRYNLKFLAIFILSVVVSSIVEYLCAACIVLLLGHNPFWNYSNRFLNINGYICLKNSLLFGVALTFFIYKVLPTSEKIFDKLKKSIPLNVFFWLLLVVYILDLLYIILT